MNAAWPKVTFDDAPLQIIDGDRGSNYPKQDEFHDEGHCLFLNTGNVTKSGFDFGNCQFISEQRDSLLRKGKLSREDVIMTTRGTIGNVGYFNQNVPFEHIRINSGMVIFRANREKLLPSFLYQYLRSEQFNKQVNSLRSGAAQPQLPIRDIKVIELPLPSVDQQEAISGLISKYDDLIENNKRRIELLEESARQLYKEWFVRFRFPGHEHVKIIDGVPEGWETMELQDVCERITDGAHHSPKGVDDGLPMASVKDMHSWGIDLKNCRKISNDDFEKLEKGDCRPKQGDVLIAKDGSYLKHVFVAEENAPYVLLSSIAILRPNERIKSNQLAMFLGLPRTKKRLTGYVSGVALPRIILKEFRKFTFLCPPLRLQEMWAENYDCIFDLCRTLIKENEKLSNARDLLLPKLMNGEIAV